MWPHAQANGPADAGEMTVQEFDLYSRKFYCLASAADLNGTRMDFFDASIGNSYLPYGGTSGTTPQWTLKDQDTNLDTPGAIPFDKTYIQGIAFHPVNLQLTPGTVGAASDKAFYAHVLECLLNDLYCVFQVGDTTMYRGLAINIPGAAGLSGAVSQGTTAALTVGASNTIISNGLPVVTNYLSFGNNGYALRKGDRLKFNATFGPSTVNNSGTSVYKPAIGSNQPTAFLVTLKCKRLVPAI